MPKAVKDGLRSDGFDVTEYEPRKFEASDVDRASLIVSFDQDIASIVGAQTILRIGTLGFGGPVVLVGQMERELVTERAWLTKDELREVIAVCQSLLVSAFSSPILGGLPSFDILSS